MGLVGFIITGQEDEEDDGANSGFVWQLPMDVDTLYVTVAESLLQDIIKTDPHIITPDTFTQLRVPAQLQPAVMFTPSVAPSIGPASSQQYSIDEEGQTNLHKAAARGDAAECAYILQSNPQLIYVTDNNGWYVGTSRLMLVR